MPRAVITVIGLCLLVLLTACGGASVAQTSQTEHYTVQLSLDGAGFDERTAAIEITDRAGQPVAADQVVLAPTMKSMGMASPEAPARMIAPGRYEAQGAFFSMLGEWDLDVRVSAGGAEEVANFKIQIDQ
jgi:hypothetical protein